MDRHDSLALKSAAHMVGKRFRRQVWGYTSWAFQRLRLRLARVLELIAGSLGVNADCAERAE